MTNSIKAPDKKDIPEANILLKEILSELKELNKALKNITEQAIPNREFLTLKEAEKLSGLSLKTLRKYISQGILRRYGPKRRVLVSKSELEKKLRQGFSEEISIRPSCGRIKPIWVK